MKNIFGIFVILFVLSISFSCDREKLDFDDYETAISSDEALLNLIGDELLQMSEEAIAVETNSGGRTSQTFCATVEHSAANQQITLDFGAGCTGPYGLIREGKVFIAYAPVEGEDFYQRIITFENYKVSGYGVDGLMKVDNISRDNQGILSWSKSFVRLNITFPQGGSLFLDGVRNWEWLEGEGDGILTNNVFKLTGNLTGTSRLGTPFSSEITTPIIINTSCASSSTFMRVSGVKEVTRGDLAGHSVDFGDGACDNVITITTPRRTFEVTIQ